MYNAQDRRAVEEAIKTLGTPSCDPVPMARNDHEKIHYLLHCRRSGLSEGQLEEMDQETDLLRAVIAALLDTLIKRAALTTDELITIIAAGSTSDWRDRL